MTHPWDFAAQNHPSCGKITIPVVATLTKPLRHNHDTDCGKKHFKHRTNFRDETTVYGLQLLLYSLRHKYHTFQAKLPIRGATSLQFAVQLPYPQAYLRMSARTLAAQYKLTCCERTPWPSGGSTCRTSRRYSGRLPAGYACAGTCNAPGTQGSRSSGGLLSARGG